MSADTDVKRILIAVGALIVVAIIAFLVLGLREERSAPKPLIETSFVGFTNTPNGSLAMVSAHFRPKFDGCAWPTYRTFRQVNGMWWAWTPARGDKRPAYDIINSPRPLPKGRDGKTINHHIAFAVENTNDAWRFVMEVKENPPGDTPFVRRVRSWWNTLRGFKPPPRPTASWYSGNHYFLTNETKMN